MTEPTTVNRALIVPNTGDLPGTWGSAAINPDLVSIDAMFGGVTTVSLTNSNVVLSVPAGYTATPSAGPTQSQNAVIRFTGTLTGNCQITFPMPGIYIADTTSPTLVMGSHVITLFTGVGGGKVVALPPGEAVDVYNDGTDFTFRNLGRIGGYLDLGTSTVPSWITACTVPPYLNCDGTTFSAITYPVLNGLLGGNTLPDLRGRVRAALNQTTGRITSAVSGVDGNTLLAAGGSQSHTMSVSEMPAHNHTDLGHTHDVKYTFAGGYQSGAPNGAVISLTSAGASTGTGAAVTGNANIQNTGGGTAFTVLNPIAISGLTLIRAG